MSPVNLELSEQRVHIPQRHLLRWRQLSVLVVLVAFIYYPVFDKLVHQWWNDSNFSHRFIVPLFSLYLLFVWVGGQCAAKGGAQSGCSQRTSS